MQDLMAVDFLRADFFWNALERTFNQAYISKHGLLPGIGL